MNKIIINSNSSSSLRYCKAKRQPKTMHSTLGQSEKVVVVIVVIVYKNYFSKSDSKKEKKKEEKTTKWRSKISAESGP